MGFSPDYLYYFHYSDSIGYLIFCCHTVAVAIALQLSYKQTLDHILINLSNIKIFSSTVELTPRIAPPTPPERAFFPNSFE